MRNTKDIVGFRDRDLRNEGLYIAEGRLLVTRAIASGHEIVHVFADTACTDEVQEFEKAGFPVSVCSRAEMGQLAGFPFHRGMYALVKRPKFVFIEPDSGFSSFTSNKILVLPSITDPGNLGTLLRSALAFGFTAVILGQKTCDPFNRKALRASMGATFSLHLVDGDPDTVTMLSKAGFHILAAEIAEDSHDINDIDGNFDKLALILGNEYEGIPEEWKKWRNCSIQIPVNSAVDSLNVAVAGSILMRELTRLTHL